MSNPCFNYIHSHQYKNHCVYFTNIFYYNDFSERDNIVQNYRPMSIGSRQVTLSWEKPKKTDVTQYVVSGQRTVILIHTLYTYINDIIP